MPFITARVFSVVRMDTGAAIAFAGENQSVLCEALVQLEASIIGDDIENHTFEWEQTSGTPIISDDIFNINTLTPSFINPQVSDIEWTFYLDRNTPFEDSDVVIISRAPTTFVTSGLGGGDAGTTGIAGVGAAGTNRAGLTTNEFTNDEAHVTGWAFTNPPTARYSPIFKAEDLNRIRDNLSGQYWLMKDIDLSEYSNWDPIGSATRPFIGELQGNGFVIDNLTITSAIDDPDFASVVLLLEFGDADGSTTTTDLSNSAHSMTFNGAGVEVDTSQSMFGTGALFIPLDTEGSVSTPDSADFEQAADDWTIELDVRFANMPLTGQNDNPIFCSKGDWTASSDHGFSLDWWNNDIRFIWSTDGDDTALVTAGWNPVADTWYHIDAQRLGNFIDIYIDGTRIMHDAMSDTVYNSSEAFFVGGGIFLADSNTDGWITNFRYTKGIARHSGTSTVVPTGLYSNTFNNNEKVGGLFAYLGNGTLIEKLGVTNAFIDGVNSSKYKGILAAVVSGAVTIRDTYTQGTVASGGDLAGGFIGDTGTDAGSTFTNTYSDVTVSSGGGADIGGWAGTFDGTPTYTENYGNTDKTASIVGTGSPAAGEIEGRTTAQLNLEAQYTDWDFTDTWKIDEGVSPATIQRDNTFVRTTGECDDQWMILWGYPSITPSTVKGSGPVYTYKGAIIHEALSNGNWGYPRFIPNNRAGGLMTPSTQHRITSVWEYTPDGITSSQTSPTEEFQVINDEKFTSKETSSSFGPYGNDTITTPTGGGVEAYSDNIVITIANPTKITKAVNDLVTFGEAGTTALTENDSILRVNGVNAPLVSDLFNHGSGGIETCTENTVITRTNGVSIG